MQHLQFVERVGDAPHFRFVLRDSDRGVWDGTVWNCDDHTALIFHDLREAANALNVIQTIENLDRPSADYTARVAIRVIGESPPSVDDLRDFLIRATELRVVEAPNDGSLLQVEIDWGSLRGGGTG